MVVFGNDTITLFNRFFDDETESETWTANVLKNVNVVETHGRNIDKSGMKEADSVKVFLDSDSYPSEKVYTDPKEWSRMGNTERTSAFTIAPSEDFFVVGDLSGLEPTEEGFFQFVKDTFDRVYAITTVDFFDDVMPHIEIGGK